jgi:hypothetical protein
MHFRDGQFVNTRCFTLDVTEQKKTETALVGIAEVGLDGRFCGPMHGSTS